MGFELGLELGPGLWVVVVISASVMVVEFRITRSVHVGSMNESASVGVVGI